MSAPNKPEDGEPPYWTVIAIATAVPLGALSAVALVLTVLGLLP